MFCPQDPFVQYLQTRKGSRLYLKPYVGNSGDHLIWLGNEILLKELGISQVVDPRQADIILWPGGNPAMWQGNLDGWLECWRLFPTAEFVIAPATFQGETLDWRTLLKTSKARIGGVFARDMKSYRNLQQLELPGKITIGLGHDPAFHLKESKWIARHREAATSEYVLASFRGDHESAFVPPVLGKLFKTRPLSSILYRYQRHGQNRFNQKRLNAIRQLSGPESIVFERDAPLMSFESFVESVRRASQVHTDRLHCMIMALLLGKPTFAYPTAYSKLEDVYEHSIKSWATVTFVLDGD
jgi:exopolysaccharide biosynthesis predicted pyruvyltransferase EpsI